MINKVFKGESLIKDDIKVADVCGSSNSGTIDAEGKL